MVLDYKKYRTRIKKKSEQIVRLRKKLRKDSSSSLAASALTSSSRPLPADPSVQRLVDGCVKELHLQLRQLEDREKCAVRRVMAEERARYCTVAACVKPIVDEEVAMLAEMQQIEDVMQKMAKASLARTSSKQRMN